MRFEVAARRPGRRGKARRARGGAARLAVGVMLLALAGCGGSGTGSAAASAPSSGPASVSSAATAGAQTAAVPQPAHTVVVVMENHSYADIIGNPATPFINALARQGALFTRSFAITHPSEPNYLALFSGSTQGVTNDGCPDQFTTPNLAADLIKAGESFAGYAEDLPSTGSSVCAAGEYARKHVPWADFGNVPGSVSKPFTSFPKTAFARLPAVSFVIPNLCDDMHDCSASAGDTWLRANLAGYADWAMKHDSLLILTWDEDDGSQANQIPTIFAGQLVRPGRYAEAINHYRVLATIEAAYGLPRDGHAATVAPITDIWRSGQQ